MTQFVNPYNFVPLARDTDERRDRPTGHDRSHPHLLTGSLHVTLTATTPLSVRHAPADWNPATNQPLPEPVVRGSSIRGALRTLHEALTGSCLRVFDPDFVPVYREEADHARNPRRMAIVTEVRHTLGQVTSLKLAVSQPADVVEIATTVLSTAHRSQPWLARTGARLRVDDETEETVRGSIVRRATSVTLADDGDYILHVSSTTARDSRHPWRFRAVREGAGDVQLIDSEVLADFHATVAGLRDRRKDPKWLGERVEGGWTYDAVGDRVFNEGHGGGVRFGYRLAARGPLSPNGDPSDPTHREVLRVGQPVYVTLDEVTGKVTAVLLSAIWRVRGKGASGERVADSGPCTHVDRLCPSCRVFGSADTSGRRDDEKAVQNSYAGHVRVDDAVRTSGGAVEPIFLPRVDAPRPGAGQFYLEDVSVTAASGGQRQRELPPPARRPAREWGSDRDARGLRQLRGRKFYYTSSWQPRQQQLAGLPHTEGEERRVAFPAGSTFTSTVTFANVSLAELGSVIAALDPRLWLDAWAGRPDDVDPGTARFRLGGGKPRGLGAMTTALELTIDDPWATWLGSPPDDLDLSPAVRAHRPAAPAGETPEDAVAAFVAAAPAAVVDTWRALAHVVCEDFVAPTLVAYPYAADHPLTDEKKPFHFWSGSRGNFREAARARPGTRAKPDMFTPLITLPQADGAADSHVLNTHDAGQREVTP